MIGFGPESNVCNQVSIYVFKVMVRLCLGIIQIKIECYFGFYIHHYTILLSQVIITIESGTTSIVGNYSTLAP